MSFVVCATVNEPKQNLAKLVAEKPQGHLQRAIHTVAQPTGYIVYAFIGSAFSRLPLPRRVQTVRAAIPPAR